MKTGCSMKIPRMRLRIPQTSNCPTENDMDSNLDANFPSSETCNAQNNAPTSSIASPIWNSNLPPVESTNAPAAASATAMIANQCGFSPHPKKRTIGTRTTYRLVINPALPAVVYCIPACWRAAATNNKTPAMNIHLYCSRDNSWVGLLGSVCKMQKSD